MTGNLAGVTDDVPVTDKKMHMYSYFHWTEAM